MNPVAGSAGWQLRAVRTTSPPARFRDITDGKLGGDDGDGLGSMMVHQDRLIVGSYVYYDAAATQQRFVGTSSLDLSAAGDFAGFFAPSGPNPGKLGRYMTLVPAGWRSRLGGHALTGACCLSIISRTNFGPGASVFDPGDVGNRDPIPFQEVLGYPQDHPVRFGSEVGNCGGQSSVFNCTTWMVGVAFPSGTRSVLFFGSQGVGPNCYKCNGAGGYYAPPYRSQIWAYDANELVAVKNGQKQAWEVSPYAVWQTSFELNADSVTFSGGTFDPETSRMFLVEANGEDPIVHVLRIRTPNG